MNIQQKATSLNSQQKRDDWFSWKHDLTCLDHTWTSSSSRFQWAVQDVNNPAKLQLSFSKPLLHNGSQIQKQTHQYTQASVESNLFRFTAKPFRIKRAVFHSDYFAKPSSHHRTHLTDLFSYYLRIVRILHWLSFICTAFPEPCPWPQPVTLSLTVFTLISCYVYPQL